MNKILLKLLGGVMLSLAGAANAVPYLFVDWTAGNPAAGTASGTITLQDSSTISVGFSVTQASGAAGSYKFIQTNGGTNYWSPTTP